MTTAARPTFEPARGGRGKGENDLSALSKQYSSRDMPAQLKMKTRQPGQDTQEEVASRDLRKELDHKEITAKEKSDRHHPTQDGGSSKRQRIEHLTVFKLDADDFQAGTVDSSINQIPTSLIMLQIQMSRGVDLGDEDDESDDDTAELLAELQAIKKERKEEDLKQEAEKKVEEERIRNENLLSGNPLLNYQTQSYKVKRRWDDDVVFKNCAKGEDKKKEQHFINDTIRSEFHKKFMSKYIK